MKSHDMLFALAARLPCRTIMGEAGPYLSRYTLYDIPGGGHAFLHYFHRGDADKTLHNHPWCGESLILSGGYREERREVMAVSGGRDVYCVTERVYLPGDVNVLQPDTFHRVDLLTDGCWTLFLVGARVQSWGFWDRETGVVTPWREALASRGLMPSDAS